MAGLPSQAELICLQNIRDFESTLVDWINVFDKSDKKQIYASYKGKQAKYKAKLVAKGCCPHCGKPCAPYYECEERREYKRAYCRKLRERRGSAHYKPTAPWDSRLEPKQNKGKP